MAKQYKGVSYNRLTGLYYSTVMEKKIKYNCGSHETEAEAVKARDRKILEKGLKAPLQILKPVNK